MVRAFVRENVRDFRCFLFGEDFVFCVTEAFLGQICTRLLLVTSNMYSKGNHSG